MRRGSLPTRCPHPAQSTSWRLERAGTLAAGPPAAGRARRPSRGRGEIHIRQSDLTGHPLASAVLACPVSGQTAGDPLRKGHLGTSQPRDTRGAGQLESSRVLGPSRQDPAGFGGCGGLHFSSSPFPEVWEFVRLGVWRTEFFPLRPRSPVPSVSLALELILQFPLL